MRASAVLMLFLRFSSLKAYRRPSWSFSRRQVRCSSSSVDEISSAEEEVVEESDGSRPSSSRRRKKLRQHVNPLAAQHQAPIRLDDNWVASSFSNPHLPFVIDVGCAKGGWPLQFAQSNPQTNVLGLEIRQPCVEYALRRKQHWNVTNVHFLGLNANIDLSRILQDVKKFADVDMVTIQFPDPHFKARHKKRRVVNDEFVNCLAENLSTQKNVFLQSDILELTEYMVECFSNHPHFTPCEGYDGTALHLNVNPTGILTEREIATLAKPQDVYRMMFRRI